MVLSLSQRSGEPVSRTRDHLHVIEQQEEDLIMRVQAAFSTGVSLASLLARLTAQLDSA